MDQLFAPWRIEWVERDLDRESEGSTPDSENGECPFCSLPAAAADRENRIVARGEHAFCLLNNYPYNPGHAMVIPYRHTGDYRDLSEEVLLGHARLTQRTISALDESLGPDGFNAGLNLGSAAGGSIGDHLHTHVVPRWAGDTNFMAVIGDTKVVVEALEDTYERLQAAFAAQEGVTIDGTDEAVRIE
ncbi:HIT family hydrolase [Halobacteriales archaeon QS_4_69_34]|nr:MAG: HIT family hydrolase [Halobacteriales archaeon QS_4_69_34]